MIEYLTSLKNTLYSIFSILVSKLEQVLPLTSVAEKIMFMIFAIGVIYILLTDWKRWLKLLALMVIAGLIVTIALT